MSSCLCFHSGSHRLSWQTTFTFSPSWWLHSKCPLKCSSVCFQAWGNGTKTRFPGQWQSRGWSDCRDNSAVKTSDGCGEGAQHFRAVFSLNTAIYPKRESLDLDVAGIEKKDGTFENKLKFYFVNVCFWKYPAGLKQPPTKLGCFWTGDSLMLTDSALILLPAHTQHCWSLLTTVTCSLH